MGCSVALSMRISGTPEEQVAGMSQASLWPDLETLAPTLAYDHAGIIGRDCAVPKDRLAELQVPVLVLCGGASPPFMHNTAQTMARWSPKQNSAHWTGRTTFRNPRRSPRC